MQKVQVVASLGQRGLMLPVWVKAALAANDRMKVYLTFLQLAADHAAHPKNSVPQLAKEMADAGLDGPWLHEIAAAARLVDAEYLLPDLSRFVKCLRDDLTIMARPLVDAAPGVADPHIRVDRWLAWLDALPADRLTPKQIDLLTRGRRDGPDSVHILIMDMHKQINTLSGELATEVIDGANVWDLQPADRLRVAAFMRGLNRTASLKFDHPGLETVATRDGEKLLLQNDIGTNDAHVLVLQLTARTIALTYSDLHRSRLDFFQTLLAPFGAKWSEPVSRTSADLNEGNAYVVATAQFVCQDDDTLDATLEGIGSRIVFLIDWNHARKRLQAFVDKTVAISVLAEAARLDIGHRAWLQAGGERLIFSAMQAAGEDAFRIGDRLEDILGAADAQVFLLTVMQLAREALRAGRPSALVADETRMLLARHVRHRRGEFDLLAEHAAYCQALGQAVSDGLAHGAESSPKAAQALAVRAKGWERKADDLVMQSREKAERQPRWRSVVRLAEQSDNVADALEEAAFLISLIADHHAKGWTQDVRDVLIRLAATVQEATQEYVKAIAIARTLGSDSETAENDAFLAAIWRVLQAEIQCDALLRDARRVILGTIQDAASLLLASDLATALEGASDRLLAAAYALRDATFEHTGTHA